VKTFLASLAVAATGALAATGPLAAPSEITAQYELAHKALGVIGRVNETFVRNGDSYTIRSVSRSEGALRVFLDDQIVLESSGKVNALGLQPLTFGQRRVNSSKGEVRATFDWDKGIMHSVQGGETSDVPLPRATQDRISVMYQFMNLPMGEASVTMHMSNGRKVELYTYRLVEEARVTTPAGEFDTLHYARVTASPKDSKADVWLAKDRFNFPVRLVFDDPKGLRLEQTLVALEAR
jgi:hypothetical protein